MPRERESLQKLYVEQLNDLRSAEEQILEALPRMAEKTKHTELRLAFQQHFQQTEQQLHRLDQLFQQLGEKPDGHKCKGMEGLIKEGEEIMKEFHDSDVLDAGLIAAAQRVEHYEIAGYGCARTYARMLGLEEQAQVLQRTLEEEGDTDHRLTELAETVVNIDAMK